MKNIIALLLIVGWPLGLSHAQTTIDRQFFDEVDALFKKTVRGGLVDYASLVDDASYEQVVNKLATADLSGLTEQEVIAFYINAYNLLVIRRVVNNYPLPSVFNEVGFFAGKKLKLAGKTVSLNTIEKEYLLKGYPDPRYHFVLVCGAMGCPPIVDFAYRPELLNEQLEQQTRLALNDPNFIQVDDEKRKVSLSQIFNWYKGDFGGSKESALQYINRYRRTTIPSDYEIGYYTYDWSLNEQPDQGTATIQSNNQNRYVVSATIPKGTLESKSFYNLYTQRVGNGESSGQRSNFFTTTYSVVYGVSNRFNAGFDLRYRRVRNDDLPASPLRLLRRVDGTNSRQGITNVGPKIRWSPTQFLPNFSIQSAFWFPLGRDLEGTEDKTFLDFDGASWLTQLFNDLSIGDNFSLFTELDFFLEDIGNRDEGDLNRFSTPVTGILSYFPNPKTTIYALANYSPYWQQDFDYFFQGGIGLKYQFTPQLEVELLYTAFTNQFLANNNGRASTFNLGFRINR